MNKTSILIIALMLLISCEAQIEKKEKKNKKIEKKQKNNSKMRTFDIINFNKNKDYLGNRDFILNDTTIHQTTMNDDDYYETCHKKGELFETVYFYYNSGKLKTTYSAFPTSFATGIEKKYDKKGNLIEEIDLDKPYTYSWEDVKKYLKNHNVTDIKSQVFYIERYNYESTTWELGFKGVYKKIEGRYVTILDGKTGEEIEIRLFKGKNCKEGASFIEYEIIYKKD